jgi:peptidoglycan/xylan/chitin deacetylase (PgdA/CDA1 family)
MYHSISDGSTEHVHPYYRTVATPEVFAGQMKYLHENGYSTVSLCETVDCIERTDHNRLRPVAITFDDGFQDFYTHAFPILNSYGFKAIVFLPTAYIGTEAQEFKGSACLNWRQVRELEKAGIEFGSHTVTHPQLKSLKSEHVLDELRSSMEMIEQQLGRPVKSFSYPYAFPETDRAFRQRLRGFLEESGYANGVSTIIGTADRTGDRFFMKRLPVNSCDDPRLFRAKLEGAYDWLHTVQHVSKRIAAYRQGLGGDRFRSLPPDEAAL